MKKPSSNVILIVIFFVGLSVLLYPTISDYINEKHQSAAIASYDAKAAEISEEDYSRYFAEAEAYNQKLADHPGAFYTPDEITGYTQTLDISGTGIMGYVSIEKLGVKLPIYHGTDATVLEIACGHLQGTSLPVGGESTHAVLSAHRGLPSAKLFTDLDKMEVGDTFTVTVLNRVLTYEVDQISIVKPSETEALQIEQGKDYCTLMTCTPYGINTHRLLVRGHRVASEEAKTVYVINEAFRIRPVLVAAILAIPMLLVFVVWVLTGSRSQGKRKEGKENEN